MVPLLLTLLSDDLKVYFLSVWLDVCSLVNLDVALTSHEWRPHWMKILHSSRSAAIDNWNHSRSSLMWLIGRKIPIIRMQIGVNAWQVRGCDLVLLQTIDLVHLGLNGCCYITDQCVSDIAQRCRKLCSIDLDGCRSLTDVGISALGTGCGQLQTINLS